MKCAGSSIPEAQILHSLDKDLALRMYTSMVKLQTMDVIFYEAQRQVHPHNPIRAQLMPTSCIFSAASGHSLRSARMA